MARQKTITVNFEPFDISDYTYPEKSKKAGQTTKRLKFRERTMDSLLRAFSGNRESLLKFVETRLSAVYVAQQADPDAAFRVPANRLLALDYFASRGLKAADKDNPTKAETRAAIALLKDPAATYTPAA
jgi:hypothetical protein